MTKKPTKPKTKPERDEYDETLYRYQLEVCRPEKHTHGTTLDDMLSCVLERQTIRKSREYIGNSRGEA